MESTDLEGTRKEQILKAAFKCLSTRNFDSVTMDEIARVAGLSKGAVYWYYKSKDELILAMVDNWIARSQQALFKMALECQLDELLYEYPRYLMTQSGLDTYHHFFMQLWSLSIENAGIREKLTRMYHDHKSKAGEFIHSAIQRQILKPGVDAESLARQIIALFDGLIIQWSYDENINPADEWKKAIDNLLNGIGLAHGTPMPLTQELPI